MNRQTVAVFFLSLVKLWIAEANVVCSSPDQSTVTSLKCNEVEMLNVQPTPICILKKGGNATLEVVFTSKVNVETLTSVCHGLIGGVPVPFNDIDHNGCDGLKPNCPVKSDQQYTFRANIPVRTIYPSMRLAVKWEEQDASNNDVFCVVLPAQIQ